MLEGGTAERRIGRGSVVGDDGVIDASASSPRAAPAYGPAPDRAATPASHGGPGRAAMPASSAGPDSAARAGGQRRRRGCKGVAQAAAALGVVAERFERYADKALGSRLEDERERPQSGRSTKSPDSPTTARGSAPKVDAELDVFS